MTPHGFWTKSTAYCSNFSLLQSHKNYTASSASSLWHGWKKRDVAPTQITPNTQRGYGEPLTQTLITHHQSTAVLLTHTVRNSKCFHTKVAAEWNHFSSWPLHPVMSSPLHLSSEATTKSKKRENCFFRVSANYPHIQGDSENTSRLYKWLPVLFFFCPEHYGTGSPLSVSHSLWYSPRDVQYRWFSE